MVEIRAFRGIRPIKEKASLIASLPYDVINREEARELAKGNEYSFLHVIKPEIDLPDDQDPYEMIVYETGKRYFDKLMKEGLFFYDDDKYLYIYAQTMNNKTQYGIVGCASSKDYLNDIIKKHELTRPDKEEDRKNHIRVSKLHYEPVFLTYKADETIDLIVNEVIKETPLYDFVAEDGIGHTFWIIKNKEYIKEIINRFGKIPHVYIADGHHRTAAAALVADEIRRANPNSTGEEEFNYFLAVFFPDNQLSIMDYNRVVKDLNNLTPSQFLKLLENDFIVEEKGENIYKPNKPHNFGMYLEGKWYSLTAKEGRYDDNDPIQVLDVTILSNLVLDKILDIKDLRKSKRIDFVGGIRGMNELKRRVDSQEMKVAFALYPVSIKQLMAVSDSGKIMPPKTTWFEPKLRSGLILHSLEL